jgi:trk system potassium uptake protein TrkA
VILARGLVGETGFPPRGVSYAGRVKAIVIGCGRVGSGVARRLDSEGWEVVAVDEKEEALGRLGESWRGGFVVGHGMDSGVLHEAGIEHADAVIVATDGDNTNLVVGQVAQKRYRVESVVVRVLDPARADFYSSRGLPTVCPTSTAIETLVDSVRRPELAQVAEREPV